MMYDINNDYTEELTEEDIVQKRLIPINFDYNYGDNTWSMKPTEGGFSSSSFKASDDQMKRMLRKMKAKDSMTYPPSKKRVTYQSMIDGIKSKSHSTIYAWKSATPKSADDIKTMML